MGKHIKYVQFSDENVSIWAAKKYLFFHEAEMAEQSAQIPEEQRIEVVCTLWNWKWDTKVLGAYPGEVAAVTLRLWMPKQIGLPRWLEILHRKQYSSRLRRKMRNMQKADEDFEGSLKGYNMLFISLPLTDEKKAWDQLVEEFYGLLENNMSRKGGNGVG